MFKRRRREAPKPVERVPIGEIEELARRAVAASGREDVEFEVSAISSGGWWLSLVAGESEEDVMVSPDGRHMSAEDKHGYYERWLTPEGLVGFIREL